MLELKPERTSVNGRLGNLSTRLAKTAGELRQAQRLRYQVFFEELSAKPNRAQQSDSIDLDDHDLNCDHLLMLEGEANIVGTQRFLTRKPGTNAPRFYSQDEFDLECLADRHADKTFMELGRSCIHPQYRTKRTAELMWHGTWSYALANKVDVMVGCASFPTHNLDEILPALQFLKSTASTSPGWEVRPTAESATEIPVSENQDIDLKPAMRLLPPLIKGYLRLGAMFSSHAVHDPVFGTIDVLVVLPVESINPRYVNYYGASAQRHASA